MNQKALETLETLKSKISNDVGEKIGSESRNMSTLRQIFNPITRLDVVKRVDYQSEAIGWDKNSQQVLKDYIERFLIKYKLSIKGTVDPILSGYYINYYGTPQDITSKDNPVINKVLEKILIKKTDKASVKLKKLTQVIYQEVYGLGIMDEFMNIPMDDDYKKIEEIAAFSPTTHWIEVSAIKCKLNKIYYPDELMKRVAKRLEANAKLTLNRANTELETQTKRGDRITMTCPPTTDFFEYNIRRHYSGGISKDVRIQLGSSSYEFEEFLDNLIPFKPRIILLGPQGSGKTTIIRDITRRFGDDVAVATIESSKELNLRDANENLIVKAFSTEVREYEDILGDVFRCGLDGTVIGEIRRSIEADSYVSVSKRQDLGVVSSTHGADGLEAIMTLKGLLMSTGNYSTDWDAIIAICMAVDVVISLAVNRETGLRYINRCEISPKIKDADINTLETVVLYEYDPEIKKLLRVNPMPDYMVEKLLKRNKALKNKIIELDKDVPENMKPKKPVHTQTTELKEGLFDAVTV